MANALQRATSFAELQTVFNQQRNRLRRSCFGVDRVSGQTFADNLQAHLRQLRDRIERDFRPDGLLAIPKLKQSGAYRIICVPTIGDRLIQFSLLRELRPRLRAMKLDNEVSFGIAPGSHRSVEAARNFACGARQRHRWVYKADIQQFFDNISRNELRSALSKRLRVPSLIPILERFMDAEIKDGLGPGWRSKVQDAGIRKGHGVRQGMPLSPLFAGAYLCGVDERLIKSGVPVARYVDDIVAFFDTEGECKAFHSELQAMLSDIGLTIGEIGGPGAKTRVFLPDESAAFLGMEIARDRRGRYSLRVPRKVREDVQERFAELASVEGLLRAHVGLTTMGRYLESVVSGYVEAYSAAHNLPEFRSLLKGLAKTAQETVLQCLFAERLLVLSAEELRFVGVEPQLANELALV
jgi:RNA-directed DNA polymerase